MQSLLLLCIGALGLIVIVVKSRNGRFNNLVALHLTMFWLEMFAYGALWLSYTSHPPLATSIVAYIAILLSLYTAVTIVCQKPLQKYSRLLETLASYLPSQYLGTALLSWLALKAVLYLRYGVVVFGAIDQRKLSGVPAVWVDLDLFLQIPAWGALFSIIVQQRIGSRPRWLWGPAIAFLCAEGFLDGSGGGKRILIIAALTYIVLPYSGRKLSLRTATMTMITVGATFFAANYYEHVRINVSEVLSQAKNQQFINWSELESAFIVSPSRSTVFQDLSLRDAPLALLYDITEQQMAYDVFADGRLAEQTLENLLPGGITAKHFENEDTLLSEIFNVPYTDLAKSSLAIVQAETGIAAYVITPVLFLGLMYVYLYLLAVRYESAVHSEGVNGYGSALEILALIGGAITTATFVENAPTGLLAIGRNVVGLLIGIAVMRTIVGWGYKMTSGQKEAAMQEGREKRLGTNWERIQNGTNA